MANESDLICPVYSYMCHGTYCSYYALRPGCTNPCSYDGPCNITSSCSNPATCRSVARDARSKSEGHFFDDHLKDNGIDAPTTSQVRPGAAVANPAPGVIIRHVRFHKNPHGQGGGTVLVARVFWVRITPKDFDPPLEAGAAANAREIERGIGYQVLGEPAPPIDRDCADGKVFTVAREPKKHGVTILVHIRENDWREYNVVLLKGQGA